jgi:hypothetical protein
LDHADADRGSRVRGLQLREALEIRAGERRIDER